MSFSEKDLGKAFKIELEKQKYVVVDRGQQYQTRFKVYLNKPIRSYTKKFRFWQEMVSDTRFTPSSQPEIDMILADDRDILRAIEIKVIKRTKKRVRPSYYEGLGQALAYFPFGFPQVAIWLCFDGNNIDKNAIEQYDDAFTKIRAAIQYSLDTTYLRITHDEEGFHFETRMYVGFATFWHPGIGIFENGKHKITWEGFNPLLTSPFNIPRIDPNLRKLYQEEAEATYKYLKEQRKMWDKRR